MFLVAKHCSTDRTVCAGSSGELAFPGSTVVWKFSADLLPNILLNHAVAMPVNCFS